MNTKNILLVAILATALLALVTNAQQGEKAELNATLTPNKQHFIVAEPIPLTFTVENRTGDPLNLKTPPRFVNSDFSIAVEKPNGEIVEPSNLFNNGIQVGREWTLAPGQKVEDREVIKNHLREIFTEPGNYKLRAKLEKAGEVVLTTEWVTITISQPTGRDAEAYAYIQGVTDADVISKAFPFHRFENNEEFLRRFPDTTYADFVRYSLGTLYSSRNERGKALELFNQLSGKESFFYADKVKAQLGGGAPQRNAPRRANK